MRQTLENLTGGHQFYHARSEEHATNDVLPFRVSPEPLALDAGQAETVVRIGQDISAYMAASVELYGNDEMVHELLSRGKPNIYKTDQDANYLFYRPDLIITSNGFTLCEVETSVFGLGLAELLNRGYGLENWETMAGPETLKDFIANSTQPNGAIVYSDKTRAFAGQLEYLASHVFSGDQRDWSAVHVSQASNQQVIYRAHYLAEYVYDHDVKDLYEPSEAHVVTPSLTPQFEEKALLAFIWDKRYEEFYKKALGPATYAFLRTVIPPTWIVGQEQYFAPGLPHNFESSTDLATLSRRQRQFVLKASGFSSDSSWGEGVVFLQSKSQNSAKSLLSAANELSTSRLYVVQQFQEGIKIPMTYETPEGDVCMSARVRLTPYFAANNGGLLGIKATGCENTQRIHASSASINTAVLVK